MIHRRTSALIYLISPETVGRFTLLDKVLVARAEEVGEVEALASSVLNLRDTVFRGVQFAVGETAKSIGHVDNTAAVLGRYKTPLIGAREVCLQAKPFTENDGESATVGV